MIIARVTLCFSCIVNRLDNLIIEAINNLQEPGGSNKTTIGTYIEVI